MLNIRTMNQCQPLTYLEPGTRVQVGNDRGIIVETIGERDQFGSPINVFICKLNQKYDRGFQEI